VNRVCSTGVIAAALGMMGALTSGTAAAKWTMEAQPLNYPNAQPRIEQPSVDGAGWLTLHGNQAMDQVSYVTSGSTLDPGFPIQVQYEFLSHSPRKADARIGGFQLMDAGVTNTGIHRDATGCDMQGDYLTVGFQWLGLFAEAVCGGPYSPVSQNVVLLRGAGQLLDTRPSPVRLACMNYNALVIDRVPQWECLSREEGIAKGFVHRVDAVLQPKASGPGFLFDLSLAGHEVHAKQDIDIAAPGRLRFGLFAYLDSSGGVQDVRNVRVTQKTLLAGDVDGRCLDVQVAGAERLVLARACNEPTQVFRRAGNRLEVGGKCLEASRSSAADLVVAPCNGGARQRWVRDAHRRLRVESRPLCIAVAADTLHARLTTCTDAPEQRFLAISA
jgi:hypothetical protein